MSSEHDPAREQTLADLQKAYTMEIESVANYLAASNNPDGILAEQIKDALASDVGEELGHAQKLAARIKELGGRVPVIRELDLQHSKLDSLAATLDLEAVVRGVLDDENAAIEHYRHIIRMTDGHDYVTQDLCIQLLADEEAHRTKFESFLTEFAHV